MYLKCYFKYMYFKILPITGRVKHILHITLYKYIRYDTVD